MSKVYEKIAAVQAALAKTGIAKGRKNQQQGYAFRGIDDVFAALAPVLAENGLCILPRVTSRECTERHTKNGGALFNVVLEVEFDFVAAEDGSCHTVRTIGEAMDSADKASNKAMSAAYKYAALMTFAIPTEGENDADAVTHDIAPSQQPAREMPTGPITDATRDWLQAQIASTGETVGAFCKFFAIDSLKDVTYEDIGSARKWVASFKKETK